MVSEEQIADEICNAFETGDIFKQDLSNNSISSLTVKHRGAQVTVTWYSTGRFRSFHYNGNEGLLPRKLERRIFKSALNRAKKLYKENFNEVFNKNADTT